LAIALMVSSGPSFPPWAQAVNPVAAVGVIWVTALLSLLRQRKALEETRLRYDQEKEFRENEELLRARAAFGRVTEELIATRDVAVYTLAKVAESRDIETGQHLERIRAYSHILALELRKDRAYARVIDDEFLTDLYRSSPLHDIGKVGIRDDILLKRGPLTPEEFESMKRHTTIGANILQDAVSHKHSAKFLEMAALIARCHHERFDGTGYPAGLSGTAIPLAARIVTLADVFDALTSERPYKEAYPPDVARQTIEDESGRHFDPAIVDACRGRFEDFVKVQLAYPNKHVQIFGVTESLLAELSK